jgi:hypothetical protein
MSERPGTNPSVTDPTRPDAGTRSSGTGAR